MKKYVITAPLLCTSLTTAGCQDSIIGEWELDDFDVECSTSITPYEYTMAKPLI